MEVAQQHKSCRAASKFSHDAVQSFAEIQGNLSAIRCNLHSLSAHSDGSIRKGRSINPLQPDPLNPRVLTVCILSFQAVERKLIAMSESAYHEAGHTLMALCVGARIDWVTIQPDWDDGPPRHAEVRIEWPADRFSEQEFYEKLVIVALSGPVAEMIHTGDPYHPGLVAEWSSDWDAAWKAASCLVKDERQRLAYLENKTVQAYRMIQQDDFWAALAAIVDELVAHETLSGQDVDEIVCQWLRIN